MAAAIVATIKAPAPPGNYNWGVFTYTPSTSYPSGGEPMTPSLFGMTKVFAVIPMGSILAAAQVITSYDAPNNTLTFYTASTGAVVANASDQSLKVQTLLVLGI